MALVGTIDQTDPPLVKRAQRYEREALEELFDRNVGRVYALCFALGGGANRAETLAAQAFLRALDRIGTSKGDARAFDGLVLRLAAQLAGKGEAPQDLLRARYQELSLHDQEVVALRLLADMESDRIVQVCHRSVGEVRRDLVRSLRHLGNHASHPLGANLRAFDDALERVIEGSDPEREGARLSAPPDAARLLDTARVVTSLPREPLGPHARARLRSRFLAEAAERRAVWVHRNRTAPLVPGIELRRGPNRISTTAALAIACVLAVVVGSTIAIFAMFSNPDSPVYPVKRFAEDALLFVNRDPTHRAGFELELAATRDREAEDMAVDGKGDLAVQAMKVRYEMLTNAGYDLAAAGDRDATWQKDRKQFDTQSSQSTVLIQQDLKGNQDREAATEVQALSQQYQQTKKAINAVLDGKAGSPSS
ncbi:MAG TPA: DUF5667 domain-containing protein [Candidatus Dormibacteraeota bacterium]|nr:DUF5667 domain-containing protein [Candidatus Dormibacteraeota bacterium]